MTSNPRTEEKIWEIRLSNIRRQIGTKIEFITISVKTALKEIARALHGHPPSDRFT